MYLTVEEGTAKWAKVPGYAVGGKTGTAQKLPRDAGTYIVSFLGAVPAINPEMVIHVSIDEPQNVIKQADSSIATKLTSRILAELLPAIGIYPEGEIDYLLPKDDEDSDIDTDNTTTDNNSEVDNHGSQETEETISSEENAEPEIPIDNSFEALEEEFEPNAIDVNDPIDE